MYAELGKNSFIVPLSLDNRKKLIRFVPVYF